MKIEKEEGIGRERLGEERNSCSGGEEQPVATAATTNMTTVAENPEQQEIC